MQIDENNTLLPEDPIHFPPATQDEGGTSHATYRSNIIGKVAEYQKGRNTAKVRRRLKKNTRMSKKANSIIRTGNSDVSILMNSETDFEMKNLNVNN